MSELKMMSDIPEAVKLSDDQITGIFRQYFNIGNSQADLFSSEQLIRRKVADAAGAHAAEYYEALLTDEAKEIEHWKQRAFNAVADTDAEVAETVRVMNLAATAELAAERGRVVDLVAALQQLHDAIDDFHASGVYMPALCALPKCHAIGYNTTEGIIHGDDCPIRIARAALEGSQ